ncbi:MAG: ABC transporter ATP-binding protein [Tissierellia bacterium]|nr:ABC transporter ATP-binding protein [Tissierellia bacterium]
MIQLKDINFSYRKDEDKILKNMDLDIKSGEAIAFIGSSGCGKTTLTRIINGLAYKFYNGYLQGEISIDSINPLEKELYEIGRKVGSIFQNPKSQFFAEIVEDEVAFGLENYGIEREEILKRIPMALESIHGQMLRDCNLFHLSSGERQKVAIASINALNPPIYVFDEPSANLDMRSVEALRKLMISLKNQGKTMIISEHRIYYLKEIVDRYYYIQNGKITHSYTKKDLINMSEYDYRGLGLRSFDLDIISPKFSPYESKNQLTVQDLSFSYKNKKIFNDLSYSFLGGKVYGLIGENGVGKSTFAKVLAGILKENSGEVFHNGEKLKKRKRKDDIYFLSNNPDNNLFEISPEEELKLNDPNVDEKKVLKRFHLENSSGIHPQILSGGQKQRLTIAAAELLNREVYILDEPTSGLDGENMIMISNEMRRLQKMGKVIIIISHDYEFLMNSCDVILSLYKNALKEWSPSEDRKKILRILKGDESTRC